MIKEIVLLDTERDAVNSIANGVLTNYNLTEEFAFLSEAHLIAHELPKRLKRIFYQFKTEEQHLGLLIKNNPIEHGEVGPTPSEFREKEAFTLSKADIIHGLYSCLLGEPIGFKTQRWGHVFNTIIPKRELANVANNSAGSKYDFLFHTEDAFHIGMADYLGLICMRNLEKAPTTISSLKGIVIPEKFKSILFQPSFYVTANHIHENVDISMNLQKKAILFGDYNDPYLRINVNTINTEDYDDELKEALEFIISSLENNKVDIVLETGHCLYIDNFKSVHRRNAYEPLYGSQARWLTRIIVTNDLRKTRHLRTSNTSRVIG